MGGVLQAACVRLLEIEEQRVKGVVSLLVCSSPTGKLITSWMRQHPDTFEHDTAAFQPLRPHLWALTKHLLDGDDSFLTGNFDRPVNGAPAKPVEPQAPGHTPFDTDAT